MAASPGLNAARDLLKLAFVFVVVGYGTKIGFVPMHSWLPDAHAEAPAPISAMLSAVLLNCAMYALLRLEAITSHAIGSGFSHTLLLAFGCLSLVAAVFLMIVQRDLKRLLAYSSIEHMGIVALGVGIGGPLGLFGALLHAFNHSLAKTLLFFTTGKVRDTFGTLRIDRIRGMARVLPYTSIVLVVGGVALAGLPPFGLFISEFAILIVRLHRKSLPAGRAHAGCIFHRLRSAAFSICQRMLSGEPRVSRGGIKIRGFGSRSHVRLRSLPAGSRACTFRRSSPPCCTTQWRCCNERADPFFQKPQAALHEALALLEGRQLPAGFHLRQHR